jgi:DNA-binding transcriptional ArsR family regulator
MPTPLQAIPLAHAAAGRIKGCCNAVAAPLESRRAGELADLHRALADPMRVQMVHILVNASEPVCVCDFTAAFDLSQPTISHHLAKLREAGIVISSKRGIWSFYALNPEMSASAADAVRAIN